MLRILTLISLIAACLASAAARAAASYDGNRWFQVEVSVFSNDFPEYRDAEIWSPDRLRLAYPSRLIAFARLGDFFQLEDFDASVFGVERDPAPEANVVTSRQRQIQDAFARVGPFPQVQSTRLRMPDLNRTPFLLLPDSLSDFRTTNSRIEQSPDNRLLFHGLWRQPVIQTSEATSLLVVGGQRYGEHHELEGSITIRFNAGEDRVVIDANLWLSEFSRLPAEEETWTLPPLPAGVQPASIETNTESSTGQYAIRRTVQMRQSRDMRSNEFHYLDHPALGLVISVMPYDLPAPAENLPADTLPAADIGLPPGPQDF